MAVAVVAFTAIALPSFAKLPGSTFEGNDGNLLVDTPGNTDWCNENISFNAACPVGSLVPGFTEGIDLPSGKNDNSFGQGTKEANTLVHVVKGSIPPNKNDLTRFYAGFETVGVNNFLYLAWERKKNIGDANLDFEINQQAQPNLTTAGSKTLNRTAGDLLVTYDFTGSGKPTLHLLTWVTSGSCFGNHTPPCWGNRVLLGGVNEEGAVNTMSVTDPIDPDAPRTLSKGLFGEAAINLTGHFPAGTCNPFSSIFVKSRSSAQFNAELKDFIAPQSVNFQTCGTIIIHKVTVNGNGTFGYTTTGGLSPSTFNLSNGGTRTYSDVSPGGYSVTESTLPAGWTLIDLTCTHSGSGTSATTSGATVSITMATSGTVDCTYTNRMATPPPTSLPARPPPTTPVGPPQTGAGGTAHQPFPIAVVVLSGLFAMAAAAAELRRRHSKKHTA